MFELEDISSGFHDVYLNKYIDPTGSIMDFYISDSMQDMLDIDIRSEVATVVGGVNEFTSLMSDLPSLDIDTCSNDGEIAWTGGLKWSPTNDIYADVGACVNPNSVHSLTPVISSSILKSPKAQLNLNTNNFPMSSAPLISPKEKKSHLTFSPNTIKVPVVNDAKKQSLLCQTQRANIEAIKKDLNEEIKDDKMMKQLTQTIAVSKTGSNTIKLAAGIGGLTFANSLMYAKLKQTKIVSSSAANNMTQVRREQNSPFSGNPQLLPNHQQQQKIFSRSIIVQNNKLNGTSSQQVSTNMGAQHPRSQQSKPQQSSVNKQIKSKLTGMEFPKPAYSYSCLIAMALKNSRAGSLPVSEIYSFMCEHFPYFKTAPNGWKNSVRHNLSLNKCFEKIEKPATNGSQRKGCLWAMNPTKIVKMDDEIQKWSRKDPMAIKKAMEIPSNLEQLERGEMKHGSTGDCDDENDVADEDTEDNSDIDTDVDLDDTAINNATEPESCDDDERNSQIDYEIEVADYDDIDTDTIKEAHKDHDLAEDDLPSPKRARLDVNYSIGPAGIFQLVNGSQQPQPQNNRRKMTLVNRIV